MGMVINWIPVKVVIVQMKVLPNSAVQFWNAPRKPTARPAILTMGIQPDMEIIAQIVIKV